jgi:hypothetical protein
MIATPDYKLCFQPTFFLCFERSIKSLPGPPLLALSKLDQPVSCREQQLAESHLSEFKEFRFVA